MNKLKKQIAFVLAFVMVFSLLPVTAFGRAGAPGNVATLPTTGYSNRRIVNQDSYSHLLRRVRFDALDFGAAGVESTVSVARVRMYRRGAYFTAATGGAIRPYYLPAARRVDNYGLPPNIRHAIPAGYAYDDSRVLYFHETADRAMTVALVQYRRSNYWAWLIIEVDGTQPGWFNRRVEMPISYSANVGPAAYGSSPVEFRIYNRFAGRFTERQDIPVGRFARPEAFRVQYYGTVPTFTDEVDLPGRIRVIEDIVASFDNRYWRVDVRLPRGFSWGTAPSAVATYRNYLNGVTWGGRRFDTRSPLALDTEHLVNIGLLVETNKTVCLSLSALEVTVICSVIQVVSKSDIIVMAQ